MLRVALMTLGIAGGVYAAEQVTAPPPAEMGKTVNTQRAGEGRRLTPEEFEHQRETLTHEQMLELSDKYKQEMSVALEHGEATRIVAHRSRDIIRITCIEDKLAQMKEVIKIATPRFLTAQTLENEQLVIRQYFTIVFQARERVSELSVEVDSCVGDSVDVVAYGRLRQETPGSDNVFDPTRPPDPTGVVDRPPEASPFR